MTKKEYIQPHINSKINRLTIIEQHLDETKYSKVIAMCECGVQKVYTLTCILSGHTKSCGCLHVDRNKEKFTTHGLSGHPLNHVWRDMLYRCSNEKAYEYKWYGGRGVEVCQEWKDDFKPFYDWAITHGWEKGLELDKDILSPFKVGMIYSPEFCCFATKKQNGYKKNRTRIVEFNGDKKCLGEWAETLGKPYSTLFNRLKRGMSVEDAFMLPNLNQSKKLAS